jgi:hypothetical protein
MAQSSQGSGHQVSSTEIDTVVSGLAAAAQITTDEAKRVLDVLGLDKMVLNYETAHGLVQNELNMAALAIPRGTKALPDFSFNNLGIAMVDHTARVAAVHR